MCTHTCSALDKVQFLVSVEVEDDAKSGRNAVFLLFPLPVGGMELCPHTISSQEDSQGLNLGTDTQCSGKSSLSFP